MITQRGIAVLVEAIDAVRVLADQTREGVHAQLRSPVVDEHDGLRAFLSEIEAESDRIGSDLGSSLARFPAHASTARRTVAALVGTAARLVESARADQAASRLLRDDYVALSLARIQTRMLEATAQGLEDRETERLAARWRLHLGDQLERIESTLPIVLQRELRERESAFPER